MLACCEYGVERGWRHFFYGGKEGVAEALSKTLMQKYPGMITAGTLCPPFRPLSEAEDADIVKRINDSRPDIVWVGLGLLKQERWIATHLDRIEAPWMSGVGAAFDYHTGNAKWAPPWLRACGLEWLYRLCHEPRMFVRNVRSAVFVIEAVLGRRAASVADVPALKAAQRHSGSGTEEIG
jgi:N-acetylglucosaminyldiphosphoundecaprenol N-acetyl-beta-D-mannosaminyltransferase